MKSNQIIIDEAMGLNEEQMKVLNDTSKVKLYQSHSFRYRGKSLTWESMTRALEHHKARQIREIIGDLEPEGSNYYASARNGLRRKQYEKARELGFDIKLKEGKNEE